MPLYMGAKDLKKLLEGERVEFEGLRGTLAVDAYNTLYQFATTIRQPDGSQLKDSRGRVTSHLSGLFYRTCSLLEKGVKPVYVFDGKPSILKKQEVDRRKKKKEEAEELRKKALKEGRLADAARLAQRTTRITREMVGESKKLLGSMGLPWVQAPSEGEAQCAFMAAKGVVPAAATQDFDALLFGAPVLVRNLTLAGKRRLPGGRGFTEVSPERFVLSEELARLELSREQLVWIGLLCGTDFNSGISGVGPMKSLKLVREHSSLREICVELEQDYESFHEVEQLFLEPNVEETAEPGFGEPDNDAVLRFMCDERDFSEARVDSALRKAFNQPLDENQGTLKKWF
jgi:flap endonuclease-1